MDKSFLPNYIIESSWEVCNKVGGIYTVLSSRARMMQLFKHDKVIFIGPDFGDKVPSDIFEPDYRIFPNWQVAAAEEGLHIRVGRWLIPGNPIAVLVEYEQYYSNKNYIYSKLWSDFSVDSLHSYGDYDEASMFSYASAKVVESFCSHVANMNDNIVFHGNEWMSGLGLLYVRKFLPHVATVFTTHATSIGRSIAGNGKPLYDYFTGYNGDQMAFELNMQSKHSIEKQTAHNVDCFTTVSSITARECEQLLEKAPDIVTPNGFNDDFVPYGTGYTRRRYESRRKLFKIANALTGKRFSETTTIISISGRNEFRNKGIDIFIRAVKNLKNYENKKRSILALVCVPCWTSGAREDLTERLSVKTKYDTPLPNSFTTHELHDMEHDTIAQQLKSFDNTDKSCDVTILMVPVYLDGKDGIVNMSYYDTLIANDLCIYPSYYEPWGYTPLESIAFHIPCITTSLAGFGQWVLQEFKGKETSLNRGVLVVERNDHNEDEVVGKITDAILNYVSNDGDTTKRAHEHARRLSLKALWTNFFDNYIEAYDIAFKKAFERRKNS